MTRITAALIEAPIALSLTPAKIIVTPALDPVVGWIGEESTRPPHSLRFPESLLEESATSNIVYACNLPAPASFENEALAYATGNADEIAPGIERAFLRTSLPGGQTRIISEEGAPVSLRFRWVCISAHSSIGSVWRCFVQSSSGARDWSAIGHDYVFEAGSCLLLNAAEPVNLPLSPAGSSVTLTHPTGLLTCLPCRSGRVKVTRLLPDGRAKRSLRSLHLHADRSIIAHFSNGSYWKFAVAAPAGVVGLAA